jgi:hypothetical protein
LIGATALPESWRPLAATVAQVVSAAMAPGTTLSRSAARQLFISMSIAFSGLACLADVDSAGGRRFRWPDRW